MTGVSPLAPATYPTLPPVAGVRFATAEAGIKGAGRSDVLLAAFDKGTTVAGVFTRSRCPSAPVDWCRTALQSGRARGLLVNSGNANAFTGKRGRDTVKLSAAMAASALGCRPREVFLASTGVIGEPLDPAKFDGVVAGMADDLDDGPWLEAARAIMTTDTYPKVATRTVELDGVPMTINGIAKGAGMIAPDMATMLSFVFTDAPIAAAVTQSMLARGVDGSFNAITVDSDTSTSDTVLVFATGQAAGIRPLTSTRDRRTTTFRAALDSLLLDLAHQIVRDGEGATKFAEVRVKGATSNRSAKRIALAIANSPLVKTALAGEDANWGRVVMAVGKAGEPANRDRLAIWFGDLRVAHRGERDPAYSEAEASAYMKNESILLTVDVGVGKGTAQVWTCDLTRDYIAINADYRT
ncbi:bifunctional glutamate N-acetyltransferase/amino-acid acetyltransferase ArgJ [Bauldia sp.]|uniref:bifunctional glutamate N-acetyltransferase/amino-acid acetyltransferase ArgJ n=1 Tax=Bauldia sp. TaxID=2575872 RepID=UPI003BA99641